MGNDLGWGSDKSSENCFAVQDLSRASPKFISHERREKDTHSLIESKWYDTFQAIVNTNHTS